MTDTRGSRSGEVVVVDVGARWGAAEAWQALAPEVRVIGFDADAEECARLNELARERGETTTYVPVALGPRRETVDLHMTIGPGCTSIYPPRPELVAGVPALAEMALEQTRKLDLVPLDEWCAAHDVDHVDVIKLDTQGSELGVLQGGVGALSSCVLVECEVEFNPLYEGQPLFSDVDAFLRDQGFVLWRLDNLTHYTDGGAMGRLDAAVTTHSDERTALARIGGGQLFWCDAFWVRADLLWPTGPEDAARAERAGRIAQAAGLPDLAARLWPACAPELVADARRARRGRRADRRAARPHSGQPTTPRPAHLDHQGPVAGILRRTRSRAGRLARRA